MPKDELYDIYQAADELQLSAAYIRMQIRNGVILSEMVPVTEGSKVTKHMIRKSELIAFASRDHARAPRRNDGRAKCCFYATDEEVDRIKELLYATHDPGLSIVALSILKNGRSTSEHYIPPSKQ